MSIFPGAIASFLGFTSGHTLSADQHASQHNSEQTEIVATQTKIGTGSSTPTSGLLLRGTGTGTSSWAQANLTSDVTGVLPQANGGTGTTLATGTGKAVYDTSPTISSPTLTTPTIASFVNANHDHSNAQNGGAALNSPTITTPIINQINSTDNISLNATTNKLVKTTVLRQDDTTNTYQPGNSVTLTGWGVLPFTNGSGQFSEVVTLGVTFVQRPIVVVCFGGDHASATTYGSGGNNINAGLEIKAETITTTSFVVRIFKADNTVMSAGGNAFYQWIAIGEI